MYQTIENPLDIAYQVSSVFACINVAPLLDQLGSLFLDLSTRCWIRIHLEFAHEFFKVLTSFHF